MTEHRRILGMRVDATDYVDATQKILRWAQAGQSRYVCASNVHMIMESHDSNDFHQVMEAADLVTADGMPLVWMLRWLGVPKPSRVYGPELMLRICREAAQCQIPIALYGSRNEVLQALTRRLLDLYPSLNIAYQHSPPFAPISLHDNQQELQQLKNSGARIIFVGLGCPKQERWMAQHAGQLPAVMVGVGAAFDFNAGLLRQAPAWIQRCGFEWLFRLCMEPRRLWKRYLKHNSRFMCLAMIQLLQRRTWQQPDLEPLNTGHETRM